MVLTYKGIHTKLVREIGKANEFECVDCGKQAHEWSYVHDTDPQDIDNYDPRCRSCHKLYDGIKPTKFGHITEPGCRDCNQLVAEKQDLRDVLSGLRGANRQAYRQIALFLEDGLRERLIVAQAILDPDEKESTVSEWPHGYKSPSVPRSEMKPPPDSACKKWCARCDGDWPGPRGDGPCPQCGCLPPKPIEHL